MTTYLTTPIFYVNSAPHVGTLYTALVVDTLARFQRLQNKSVFFLTGTDEHGQKIEKAAHNAQKDPQIFVNSQAHMFKDLFDTLNITYTDFIRTSENRHKEAVCAFWDRLVEKGFIYLGTYSGFYSIRDEAFYQESELVDGLAPTGAPVEWVSEDSYFFRLSTFQKNLLDYYEAHPDFIQPESRRNEVIRFVQGGLTDLSISRTSFSWGIPVPSDPRHVIYVWLDALVNYISALGYPDTKNPIFKTFWPAAIHIVGKDILRFHAIYWPAFLMAADLPLPQAIVAHGWITNHGEKMSKSLGNVMSPLDLAQEFGIDSLRYYLLRDVSFGQDGDFSKQALIRRHNGELGNAIGNLVQRVVSFALKHLGERINQPIPSSFQEEDTDLLKNVESMIPTLSTFMDNYLFHRYCELILKIAMEGNAYVDAQKPWALKKAADDRVNTVIYTLLELIRRLSIIMSPILPQTSQTLNKILGVEEPISFDEINTPPSFFKLQEPTILFPRKELL